LRFKVVFDIVFLFGINLKFKYESFGTNLFLNLLNIKGSFIHKAFVMISGLKKLYLK
jgi:hypothetical protein